MGGAKVVLCKANEVTDGPYVEVKDSIQGCLFVNARDIEQPSTGLPGS
jgi:hypothetical protein